MRNLLYIFSVCFIGCQGDSFPEPQVSDNQTFILLSPKETKVDFVNEVNDRKDFNILNYRNFYNGGGVAIGDINNDSLPDLFFTANMQHNRLYLNKGDWTFEDISQSAGIGGTRAWSTGVTMVDVNADGLLDIYVCNSGDVAGDNRENELFINQGNLQFEEQAAQWGLNNRGFSTHASFFDYDGDGDLDCYLLNNSFRSPDRIGLYQKTRIEIDPEGGDKLLRNEGDHFVDVTQKAGIYSSDIGFGLGVSVSDINQDLLPDIYISNDFWERDYLYINQGDGTFTEELQDRTSVCSMSSMGADIADLNNDGAPEIMTTDMLPGDNRRLKTMTQFTPFFLGNMKSTASYHHQLLQNCLQQNEGSGYFQEIAFLAGVAATDWSWGTLMFDFDNDGWKDIFVSNGILRDITDLDFADFITDREVVKELVSETQRADFRDFLPYMPSTKLSNYAFINQRNGRFDSKAHNLGLATPSFSNGAAYGDLDNDGDLDLVVNNLNMPSFLYRNTTSEKGKVNFLKVSFEGPVKNRFGIGAQVKITARGKIQQQQLYPVRSFESCMEPVLLFGLGGTARIDSVEVFWPDQSYQLLTGVPANQRIVLKRIDAKKVNPAKKDNPNPWFEKQGNKLFADQVVHRENDHNDFDYEPLLPHLLSTEGPKIVKGDANGDGLEDFILLGAADDPDKLYLQQRNGKFSLSAQPFFELDKGYESTCGLLLDLDKDGDLDFMVGAGGNEYQKGRGNFIMRYYENVGKTIFNSHHEIAPRIAGNFSCIAPADFDRDGDIDLFVGARNVPGNYGLKPASFLLKNDGYGLWTGITPESMKDLGMVSDALWIDIDGDQDEDLIVIGEWSPITIFANDGKKVDRKETLPNTSGWWNTLAAGDLDGDEDMDLVLGNWGLNSKFQASPERPLTMYVKDFDKNNKSEFIINWYPPLEKQPYPFSTKMDLTRQLPHLKKKILKYEEYADASYEALFTVAERRGAIEYSANWLASAVLWNDGDNFKIEDLPLEAQIAPVYAILIDDLDADGRADLWLGGNMHGLKPEVGRLDASRGVFLKGMPDRTFRYVDPEKTGLRITGQVRDVTTIQSRTKRKTLLIARNNDSAEIFTRVE